MTLLAAAVFHFSFASLTLDKQKVTRVVDTVGVGVCGLATLVTNSNNIRCNALAASFVKNKVFTNEFIF